MSGTSKQVEEKIIAEYHDKVNLYKIKMVNHGEYTTLVSIEKQ